MREILFRAKDRTGILNNSWLYGSLDNLNEDFWYITYKDRWGNKITADIDINTVGQFTGLTDKNERKIFEGDILKYKYKERINDVYIYGWVVYEESRCEFLVRFPTDPWIFSGRDFFESIEDIEVIGNIHDNPEFLEKFK